ncbi:MAG: peptidoglycan DD-metalloendopeptidase family protein [Gammaproteobacteria bacterium]
MSYILRHFEQILTKNKQQHHPMAKENQSSSVFIKERAVNHFSLHKVVFFTSLLFIIITLLSHQHTISRIHQPPPEEATLDSIENELPKVAAATSIETLLPDSDSSAINEELSQAMAKKAIVSATQPSVTQSTPVTQPIPSPQPLIEHVIVHKGDTVSRLFDHYHISQAVLQSILLHPEAKKVLTHLQVDHPLTLTFNEQRELNALSYEMTPLTHLTIKKDEANYWHAQQEQSPLVTKVLLAGGTIKQNLYQAGKDAHLPKKIILQLADVFGWQMDFARDIHKEDHFSVLYEMKYLNDKPIEVGHIIAAEIISHNQTHKAIRYTPPNGVPSYYTPEGANLRTAFLRYPIKYNRVSSPFNPNRRHPILKYIRPHWGVDLAAPRGTPIHAAGSGKVIFSGRGSGYGNHIILKHGATYSTLYAHMSRIARGISPGATVQQGQVIGYVGSTGLATGPHLHYEFRIHGRRVNPVTVQLPQGKSLPAAALATFKTVAQQQLAQLESMDWNNHGVA